MEDAIDYLAWPPVYKVKRHRRARHVRMRPSKEHGLEITIPYRFSQKELPDILEENKSWILREMAKMEATKFIALPDRLGFPFLEEQWHIRYLMSKQRLQIIESPLKELSIIGDIADTKQVRDKLVQWLKAKAKLHLPPKLREVSQQVEIAYHGVSIRDQKTQWGSCTLGKIINLNYRLIFLPDTLARHIMVHELCHIVHLDHSKRFWALVATHDAAWMENRRLLKHADQYAPAWL